MRNLILNYKLIIVALLITSLFACGGAEQRKQKYFEKGKAYFEEGNNTKARVELKNVLQIDPKDAEAYYILGQIEEKEKNWPTSFGLYKKAVELDGDNLNARAKLGNFYLLQGKLDSATEMLDVILMKDPKHPEGRLLNAGIKARKGDIIGAIGETKSLIASNPDMADAIIYLSALYVKQKQTDKAISVLTEGAKKQPKNTNMRIFLVQVYMSAKQYDKAEQVIKEVVEIEPEKFDHRLTLATFYAGTGKLDEAEKTLNDAINLAPEDMDRRLALVDFLAEKRSSGQAEEKLAAFITQYPEENRLRFGLASLYMKSGDNEKAKQVYQEILQKSGVEPDGLKARNNIALLLMKEGNLAEAKPLIEEVLKENPRDNDAQRIKGKLALAQRDPETAINAFRAVLKGQPGSAEITNLLAEAHMMNNQPELAKEVIQRSIEANPKNATLKVSLAKYFVKVRDYDSALDKVEDALNLDPADTEALVTKAQVLLAKKAFVAAEDTVQKLKAAHPDSPTAFMYMGNVLAAKKDYEGAIKEYEGALKLTNGDKTPVWASIIKVHLAEGRPDIALQKIADYKKQLPDDATIYQMAAEVYMSQKEFASAEKELTKAIDLKPDWDIPYLNLAAIKMQQEDMKGALSVYEKGLAIVPDSEKLIMLSATAYEKAGEYEKAISAYEKTLKINSHNVLAANNLAALILDHRDDQESFMRAKELVKSQEKTNQPALLDTVAWADYKLGNLESAIATLEQVVEKAPKVPIFQYHLGMAYHKQGNNDAAKTHLETALNSQQDFVGKKQARDILNNIE